MVCSYYIYYRVDPAKLAVCEKRVEQLLGAVRRSTGIGGRLLKKCGDPHLWMEVYERVALVSRFERELAAAVARLGLEDCLAPGALRRVECFEEREHG